MLALANRFFKQQEERHDEPIHLSLSVTPTEAKELTTLLEKLRSG